jgi:hypothetical protein
MKMLMRWYQFISKFFREPSRIIPPVESVESNATQDIENEKAANESSTFSKTPTPSNGLNSDLTNNQSDELVTRTVSEVRNDEIDGNESPIPETVYKSLRFDFNEYHSFFPNWGDLDPTVSTISNGREDNKRLNYLCDEFTHRYGKLTTALGYGIIFSIVKNAVEVEDRSVSSALKEAIVRSNDPLLCIAVVKDYCTRRKIHFDKYEKITDDILQSRALLYGRNFANYVGTEPTISSEEKHELIKSNWLFNAKVLEIYPKNEAGKLPLYIKVRIPSLEKSHLVRDFNKHREWRLNQNVVVQMDEPDCFRVLDFSGTK